MTDAKILIVDSEPLEAEALTEILSEDRHTVVVTAGPDEARELIADGRQAPSAILLDWDMPEQASLPLLSWIKAQDSVRDVEVVVHSDGFDEEEVRLGLEHGAYFYLSRPFDHGQLSAIMRAAVGMNELRTTLKSRARETEDAFRMLDSGTFRFRTIPQGELLAVHIASACQRPEASVGLRELVVNAVEHGNLGISYEAKGRLLAENRLEAERARRLGLPEHAARFVEVSVRRIGQELEIVIRDQGQGFEFNRYLTMDDVRLLDLHGRGVILATASLDVEYIPPGNAVRVRIPVKPGAG